MPSFFPSHISDWAHNLPSPQRVALGGAGGVCLNPRIFEISPSSSWPLHAVVFFSAADGGLRGVEALTFDFCNSSSLTHSLTHLLTRPLSSVSFSLIGKVLCVKFLWSHSRVVRSPVLWCRE